MNNKHKSIYEYVNLVIYDYDIHCEIQYFQMTVYVQYIQ